MKKKQQDTAEVKRLTVPEGYNGPMLDIRDLRVIYKTDLETVEAINGISCLLYTSTPWPPMWI